MKKEEADIFYQSCAMTTPNICLWFIWVFSSSVVWCNNEGKMKIEGSITATGTIKNFAKDSRKTVELATDIKNMLNGMCTHSKSQDNNQNIEDKFQNITTDMDLIKEQLNSIQDTVSDMDAIKEQLDRIQDIVSGNFTGQHNLPNECADVISKRVGVYTISPDNSTRIKVRCETGGWTVIQRRFNGVTVFYRNWKDYETGFGDINEEFWLGNKFIALLTSRGNHELRIDLEDWNGEKRYALYKSFKVGDHDTKYRLTVSGYSGNLGDGMTYHNNMPFSTYDNDNDKAKYSCAAHTGIKGAWWYKDCWRSNLNGKYSKLSSSIGGTKYIPWKNNVPLKKSKMMIRRT